MLNAYSDKLNKLEFILKKMFLTKQCKKKLPNVVRNCEKYTRKVRIIEKRC